MHSVLEFRLGVFYIYEQFEGQFERYLLSFFCTSFPTGAYYALIACSTDISYFAHGGGGWGEWREKVFVTRLFDAKSTEREGKAGSGRAKSAAKSSCVVD